MNSKEVMEFSRSNQKAMLLLYTATNDYAAARCLLLSGPLSGLSLGAQAIEKFLKATILLAAPGIPVGKTHDLPSLLADAEKKVPSLQALDFSPVAQRFKAYYQTRYPDNPGQPDSMDTGKRNELDRMILGLNLNLPCPRNVKIRSGLFAAITFSLNRNCTETPTERWIRLNNLALEPNWPMIEHDYFETMKAMYPDTPELHS